MSKRCFGILVMVGLCLAAVPLAAHHALAAQYDMDKPIEITGTLNKMEFINPATGGPAMPTMGSYIQLLPQGFSGRPYRSTDGTVFSVIDGRGSVTIDGQTFSFAERDVFVVPSWRTYMLAAQRETVLFSFSDRPVQKALGLWREHQG